MSLWIRTAWSLALAGGLVVASSARAAIITAEPQVIRIGVGESADVALGTSLQAPVTGIEAGLTFDYGVVDAFATIDDSLCATPTLCFATGGHDLLGALSIGIVDLFAQTEPVPTPLAGGALEFDFATVTFTGVAPGVTDVVLAAGYPTDDPHENGGAVLVRVIVPEPGLASLLGLALAMVGIARRS